MSPIPALLARRASPQGRILPSADAYVARMKHDVGLFTTWLTTYNLKGFVGEFGARADGDDIVAWQRWTEALYEALNASTADVWIAQWVGSENFPNHRLAVYRGANWQTSQTAAPLSLVSPIGKVMEQHKGAGRGINLGNSGEAGMYGSATVGATAGFSNARELPGYTFTTGGQLNNTYATDGTGNGDPYGNENYALGWNYGTAATWAYLASRGVTLVRLPFRWERTQRTMGGALDTTEIPRIQTALGYAAANGISVILDLHNGGGTYYLDNGTEGVAQQIGGTTITDADFQTLWGLLVAAFDSYSAVVAYELCNEPKAITSWTTSTAQAGVTGIRNAGSTKTIVVGLPGWSEFGDIPSGSGGFVTDPANNVRYEMHYYADYSDGNISDFTNNYQAELASAKTAGYTGTDTTPTPLTATTSVDTFSRPNAYCLGSTEDHVPAPWLEYQGGALSQSDGLFTVSNGMATAPCGASEYCAVVNYLSADATIDCDLPTVGTEANNPQGFTLRANAPVTQQLILRMPDTTLYWATYSGSTWTYTSLYTYSVTFQSGDHIQIILSGSNIQVKQTRAGVTTDGGTFSTTDGAGNTRFGLRAYINTAGTWDNWQIGP